MNTVAVASISLTALAVARICMREFEKAVVAAADAAAAGNAGGERAMAWRARKWSRRLSQATAGRRRTVDAVIRWL